MKYDDLRNLMVDKYLLPRNIRSEALIDSFRTVPRHLFVPEDYRKFAYDDYPLDIGHGQTISQPYMVALMLDLLDTTKEDVVLEIGTGSGYQTALLAEISKEVFTVERISSLMIQARSVLDELKYQNIYYRIGDGTKGWEKAYPIRQQFDKIVVSAASPSLPDSLLKQLAEGGKLVIPVGSKGMQELLLITREGDRYIEQKHGGCTFVPLIGNEGWQ